MTDNLYAQIRALVAEYGTDGGNDDLDDTVRRIIAILDDKIEKAVISVQMNYRS